jgi:hypothetical protein
MMDFTPYPLTPAASPRRGRWGRRSIAVAASVGVHLLAIVGLLFSPASAPKAIGDDGPGPISVALIAGPLVVAPIAPPSPPQPTPPKPAPAKPTHAHAHIHLRKDTSRHVPPVVHGEASATEEADDSPPVPQPSESQLASATTAESGPHGGVCNMTRLLQSALRNDRHVQEAMATARGGHGRPVLVWNGDWVRNEGEEGEGLAQVREAMIVEIGFAPKDCRAEPMHGLVLISLNDGPGGARLVFGSGVWRWSDLLMLHPRGY